MDEMEKISIDYISHKTDVSEFLTVIDMSMQKQAFLTGEIWKVIDDKESIINIVENIWEDNYLTTLENIKQALFELDEMSQTNLIKQKLIDISFDICNSRIKAANVLEKKVDVLLDQLNLANNLVINRQYEKGFQKLEKSYTDANLLIKGQVIVEDIVTETKNGEGNNSFLFFLFSIKEYGKRAYKGYYK